MLVNLKKFKNNRWCQVNEYRGVGNKKIVTCYHFQYRYFSLHSLKFTRTGLTLLELSLINPRPAGGGGGGVWTSPQGFSRLAKLRRRAAPPGFHPPYPHLFRNFCKNFDPMPCEVRSPGQVKWPNYKITFQSRHGYNVSGKVMKLSEYDELISAYKTYITDFWYRWPQVRSFLRPPHYKSMGKKSTPLYLLWCKHIWVESYRIGQLWTIRVKICIAYPSKGHLRSPEVTNRHLSITFDQKEIETWDWCQYVRLGQANPMICHMTLFGHHVTLA